MFTQITSFGVTLFQFSKFSQHVYNLEHEYQNQSTIEKLNRFSFKSPQYQIEKLFPFHQQFIE